MRILAPRFESSLAMAAPIPREPPVMIATFPFSDIVGWRAVSIV